MRRLVEVPVIPGPRGVHTLLEALRLALLHDGPAVAPIPAPARSDSPGAADIYQALVRRALRPDDPSAPLEREDIAAVVATSGSTGDPRGVLLTTAAITAQVNAIHELIGGPGDWVVSLPVHHVGGLMVLARIALGHTQAHCDPSVGGALQFDAHTFAHTTAAARACQPSGARLYCSLVPVQLRRLLDAGEVGITALRSFDAVLSGAAATPPTLLAELQATGIPLLVSYGMSETCGGCAYDGKPLTCLQISTDAADGRSLGRIIVAGPTVAAGYRMRSSADLANGQIITSDLGTLGEDGTLTVIGRADDVVIIGGNNVSVSAVENVVLELSGISDTCVIGLEDPTWGARLVAYLVTADQTITDDAVVAHVRTRLGSSAVPRTLIRLDQIPHLPTGKPDRAILRTRAQRS